MSKPEFTAEVWEKLQSYVYRLVDPDNRQTFYVGKGTGNRAFNHARGVMPLADLDRSETEESAKITRIGEIHARGQDVEIVIHRHGLNSDQALLVEAALIDAYEGLTNMQGGHHSTSFGAMTASKIFERYQAAPAKFEHQLVIINIPRTRSGVDDVEQVLQAVKGSWVLDVHRANRCDYVLAVDRGYIVGAFEGNWTKGNGRCDLVEGRRAPDDVWDAYVNHRLPEDFRKRGSANPVRYGSPERRESVELGHLPISGQV